MYFGVGDAEGHGVVGAILAGVLISEIQNLLYTQSEVRPAELIRMLHQRLLRIYGRRRLSFAVGQTLLYASMIGSRESFAMQAPESPPL